MSGPHVPALFTLLGNPPIQLSDEMGILIFSVIHGLNAVRGQ